MYFLTDSTNHLRRLLINRGAGVAAAQQSQGPSGERIFLLRDDWKREAVTVVASVWPQAETFFELLATFRLLRDNRCPSPGLIIPYLAYTRACLEPGQAKTNEMTAELIRNLNPSSLQIIGLSNLELLSKFGPFATNIEIWPLLAERLISNPPEVVVAADQAARPLASALAGMFSQPVELAYIEKERPKPGTALAKNLIGEVEGKSVLIVDDLIATGATMAEAARLVSKQGAGQIQAAAIHGLFLNDAKEKLSRLPIQEMTVTNTLPQPRDARVKVLDISPLIIKAA